MSITPTQEKSSSSEKIKTPRRSSKSLPAEPSDQAVTAADHTGVSAEDFPKPIIQLPCTELANADRLVHLFGDQIRYCYTWKKWMVWTGTHWQPDKNGTINRLAEKTVRSILIEAARDADPAAKSKWFFSSASAKAIRGMLESAQSKRSMVADDLDTHPFFLNVQNGTIDLQTGELLPHNPEHYLSRCLPIHFDPEAECLQWKDFLMSIMGGNENLVQYLQRAIGYSLTGNVREQVMFILHGNGANGKSTFLNTIQSLLGEYALQMDSETITSRQQTKIANDIARLRGARFVATSETGEGRRLDENKVKQMTGDDVLVGEFKFQEQFEFRPTHKIWLATNHLPRVKGTDHAIWRRLPLIPFSQTFWNPEKGESGPDELRMDKTLSEKLQSEAVGILTWAITGCLNWKNQGLGWPAEVMQATDAYRSTQDTLQVFLDEECFFGEKAQVKMSTLYGAYTAWASESGERPMSKKELGQRLEERGFRPERGSGNAPIRRGIGILAPQASGANYNLGFPSEDD
jgi:putative DNA primase/helicase